MMPSYVSNIRNGIRVRTTCELSMLLVSVGGGLLLAALVALFFVKSAGAVLLIFLPLLAFAGLAFWLIRHKKSALMMNRIGFEGVRSSFGEEEFCSLAWDEIGDFGVAEVKKGWFKGSYIYLSRVFVASGIRGNLIARYNPHVCIVLPCTKEIVRALSVFSGGKIDIR